VLRDSSSVLILIRAAESRLWDISPCSSTCYLSRCSSFAITRQLKLPTLSPQLQHTDLTGGTIKVLRPIKLKSDYHKRSIQNVIQNHFLWFRQIFVLLTLAIPDAQNPPFFVRYSEGPVQIVLLRNQEAVEKGIQ